MLKVLGIYSNEWRKTNPVYSDADYDLTETLSDRRTECEYIVNDPQENEEKTNG